MKMPFFFVLTSGIVTRDFARVRLVWSKVMELLPVDSGEHVFRIAESLGLR